MAIYGSHIIIIHTSSLLILNITEYNTGLFLSQFIYNHNVINK